MRALASREAVRVWERGLRQDATGRALTLLEAAMPGRTREELARYSIGRRDRCLLELRQRTFPGELNAYAECPRCAAPLEYTLAADDLRAADTAPDSTRMEADGRVLELRPIDSADLACAAQAGSVEEARRALARRCVTGAATDEFPEPLLAEIARRLAAADPGADVLIDLACPACAESWQAVFDIASYLWTEVQALAKRLMGEVHVLARAYGWRERDILAMSAARRQFYIEMVS